MTEEEFIHSIDCNFPYSHEREAKRLIQMGAELSSNAAFMVLHELCRVPRGEKIRPYQLQKLIEYWSKVFTHPLNKILVPVALKMIRKKYISVERCIKYMGIVSKYRDEYNALNILYFSCDDFDEVMEPKYEEIIHNWQSA